MTFLDMNDQESVNHPRLKIMREIETFFPTERLQESSLNSRLWIEQLLGNYIISWIFTLFVYCVFGKYGDLYLLWDRVAATALWFLRCLVVRFQTDASPRNKLFFGVRKILKCDFISFPAYKNRLFLVAGEMGQVRRGW